MIRELITKPGAYLFKGPFAAFLCQMINYDFDVSSVPFINVLKTVKVEHETICATVL